MAAGFSVKDALNKNSKAGIDESPRARFRTKDISIFKMYRNDMNFYSIEQIEELAELQREILEVVYQYLKPGGILMYSTCTICVEENEKNRAWILEHLPMEAVPLDLPEGMNADCQTCREGYLQLLPGVHQSDGFFMAKFRRRME